MKGAAGLLLTAAAFLAFSPACDHRPPGFHAKPAAFPFAGTFKASVTGPAGRLRLAGVLAAGPSGQLRVEIARGSESFLMVSGDGEHTATLSAGSLFMDESGDSGLIRMITRSGFGSAEISAALRGDSESVPAGCSLEPARWRSPGESLFVPTRVTLRCGEERMKLSVRDLVLLGPERASGAFQPLKAPAGYRRVDAEGMARAILEALPGGAPPGGR